MSTRPLAAETAGALTWREAHANDAIKTAQHVPPTLLELHEAELTTSDTGLLNGWRRIKRFLIGSPLATSQAVHERLTKFKALAVLSSDALSSVAYATEETLLVLAGVSTAALTHNIPIAIAITLLLIIVTFSYRQTIFAYPSGGGSYIVASENLGRLSGLIAAAALLIDYVLTVAVSISSGVAALTSAVPSLAAHNVLMGLGFIVFITLINLRGIRDSGSIFAIPTYFFIVSILGVLAVGIIKVLVFHDASAQSVPRDLVPGGEALGLLLLLKAFSSGCSAMTGVEAISNGVPAFEHPESKNAATTMLWMSGLLGSMFLGITYLSHVYGLVPRANETILSQLTHITIGAGVPYFIVQAATLFVLVLAANTSYADFPRLMSILARDRFVAKQFAFRGDRLAFTVGIVVLAALSAVLVVMFKGDTTALIPLYAVGVFVSFTLSQSGMVRHWWRERGPKWAAKACINGLGALVSGLVALVSGGTKLISGEPLFRAFGHDVHAGSWIVIVLIPILVGGFLVIRRHYDHAARELTPETPLSPDEIHHAIVVPIVELRLVSLQTLAYACSITKSVTALHVADDPDATAAFREAWRKKVEERPFLLDVQVVIIDSPYRSLIGPLLAFLDTFKKTHPNDTLTVILPELVPAHWWENLLHNKIALRLKTALLFRPGVITCNVPHHLRRSSP